MNSSQRFRLHVLLAAPYVIGGVACVAFPGTLLRWSLVNGATHAEDAVKRLLMACFGAQACLVGTALLMCEPTPALHSGNGAIFRIQLRLQSNWSAAALQCAANGDGFLLQCRHVRNCRRARLVGATQQYKERLKLYHFPTFIDFRGLLERFLRTFRCPLDRRPNRASAKVKD